MRKMKNYLKTGILLFGISLLLWNCENENSLIPENQTLDYNNAIDQKDIHVETLTFESFQQLPLFNKIDKYVNFNAKSRNTAQKSNHKFKIHKKNFKKITKANSDYTSYTFLITDTDDPIENGVKNLVIQEIKNQIEVFILTYQNFSITNSDKYSINENLIVEQLFDFDVSELGDLSAKDIVLIDGLGGDGTGDEPSGSGGGAYCYNVSIIIDYPCYGTGASENHYDVYDCNCSSPTLQCSLPHQEYFSTTFCSSDTNTTSAATTYIYNNNLSGGGSGNPNVTTIDNNIIISSIIENEVPEGADPLAFKLNLDSSSDAYNWLVNTATIVKKNEIGRFLEKNKFSPNAKEFALLAISALINGWEVDFEELYISYPTPDDNYLYQGPKQYIQYTLVSANGDIVMVTFVTHTIDNLSSNQQVSVDFNRCFKIFDRTS